MSAVMVRYRVKPGESASNEELVRAVFEELAQVRPAGVRCADEPPQLTRLREVGSYAGGA